MAIYDVNGNALSAVYDMNGNQLSQCYDIDGNELIDGGTTFLDETIITNVYTSSITSQPQGGCIDDEGNVYICFYSAGKFLKYNIGTSAETQYSFTGNAYGHANDMAYNPNTEYVYIASMKNTGEVYALDKSLNLVDTLYAKDENGTVFNCWCLTYDQLTRQFMTMTNDYLYFFDDNFDYVKKMPIDISFWQNTAQGFETDGEYLYCLSYNVNEIYVCDMTGGYITTISNTAFTGEPESMCYDWTNQKYYIEGKSTYGVIREAIFKQ